MKGFGYRSSFIERDWTEVRAFLSGVDWGDHVPYPVAIVDSVIASGADRLLAVTTSMHDLIITPKPVTDPPMDVVAVRAPGSLRQHAAGTVVVEHLSVQGANTSIERPASEAIPLFWRFITTEFGVQPSPASRP